VGISNAFGLLLHFWSEKHFYFLIYESRSIAKFIFYLMEFPRQCKLVAHTIFTFNHKFQYGLLNLQLFFCL